MSNHEETARNIHRSGNSCSASVYNAFKDVNTSGDGKVPAPRSEGGKCGAVLAAEKLISEMGVGDPAVFDEAFQTQSGSLKCGELLARNGRQCHEYVGFAAAKVDEMRG